MGPSKYVIKGRDQPMIDEWYQWLDSFSGPIVLDGGLGFILCDRGNELEESRLWSGRLIVANPNELKEVAKEWLECGADIISSATYQVTTQLLQDEFNLGPAEAQKAIYSAWDVLDSARHEFWEHLTECQKQRRRYPVIAVSCGPYSAILPDMSEYSGKYNGTTVNGIQDFHKQRVQVLQALIPWCSSDSNERSILCFETIGNSIEAEVITQLMGTKELCHIPYWISFQCKDGLHLSCGDLLSETVEAVLSHHAKSNLVAMGVNCVDAFDLRSLQRVLERTISSHMTGRCEGQWRVDTVCYPNSGEVWSPSGWYWRDNMYLNHTEWARLTCSTNSKIVGGCCRIGPEYIRALQRERVRLSGYQDHEE